MLNSDESKNALAVRIGGNFEPVITTCKLDWMQCPFALVYYIWYEVVTDVVDCFANETILWTVSAILFTCIAPIYLIKWKILWMKELSSNKENLTHVDSKVSDLELKINILTYKAQYGTWPLLHLSKKNSKNNLQAFSETSDENSWLKYLLMSTRKKKPNKKKSFCNIQSQLSINDLNTIDIDTKFTAPNFRNTIKKFHSENEKSSQTILEREHNKDALNNGLTVSRSKTDNVKKKKLAFMNLSEDLADDRIKQYKNPSINNRTKNNFLRIKRKLPGNVDAEIFQTAFEFSDIMTEKKPIIDNNFTDETLKLFQSSTNITLDSNIIPSKFDENYLSFSSTDIETEKDINETFDQVKENLENIHMTLQHYCLRDFREAILIADKKSIQLIDGFKEIDLYQTQENNSNNHDYLDDPLNEYNYLTTFGLQNLKAINDVSNNITTYPIYNKKVMNEQMPIELFRQRNYEKYSNFKDVEVNNHEKNENQQQTEQLNLISCKKSNECKEKCDENLVENNNTTEKYFKKLRNSNTDTKTLSAHFKLLEDNEIVKSNLAEASKESDSDDKSTNALLQEALKIKKELLLRIEMKKDKNEVNIYNAGKQDEFNNDLESQNTESHFHPIILDMITEESSGSCSTDKRIKTSKLVKKNQISQNLEVNNNNNNIQNNKYKYFINKHSLEVKIPENKSIVEQKKIKLIHNDNNNCGILYDQKNNETFKINKNSNLILSTDNINLEKNNEEDTLDSFQHISYNEINAISNLRKVNAYQNYQSLNLKTDLNLSQLSDSSSDISVDKLLDRLIESERKCKSVKTLSDAKSKQKLEIDSLNNLMDSHNLFLSAKSENEECDNFLFEFNKIILNNFEGEKIDDNFQVNNENETICDIFGIKESENYDSKLSSINSRANNTCEVKQSINKKDCSNNKNLSNNKRINLQDNSLKNSILKVQNSKTKDEKNCYYNEIKINSEHLDDILNYNLNMDFNKNLNENNINNFELKNNNHLKIYENKKHPNFISNNDKLSIKDSRHVSINVNPEIEIQKVIYKRDAGDFNNDNESYTQNFQLKEEILNTKTSNNINGIIKNNASSGDNNSSVIESNNIPLNPKKSKTFVYNTTCKIPNNNMPSIITKSEQNVLKTHKNYSSNIIQRPVKKNLDLCSTRQLKTKSNLNLTSIVKNNVLSAQKRSKSSIIPRDISLNILNSANENMCIESLTSFNKLSVKSRVPKNLSNYDNYKKINMKSGNSYYELTKVDEKSKLYIPTSKDISIEDQDIKNEIKNNSFNSLTTFSTAPSKSHIINAPIEVSVENQNNINNEKNQNFLKSLTLSIEAPPKSCILSSTNKKVEAIIKTECDSFQNNIVKEPLAILFDGYRVEEDTKLKNINIDNFNNLMEESETVFLYERNVLDLQYLNNLNQSAIIYVNFITEDGKIITKVLSSEQFLKYTKGRKFIIKNVTSKEHNGFGILNGVQLMTLSKLQGGTVIPLVNNNYLTDLNYLRSSTVQMKNVTSKPWSLKIENKKTEVLIKPSTLDTSTSISDLSNLSDVLNNKINKFQVFEVQKTQ